MFPLLHSTEGGLLKDGPFFPSSLWLQGYTEPYSAGHRMDALPYNSKAYVTQHVLDVVTVSSGPGKQDPKGKLLSSNPEEGGGPKNMALETTLNIAMFKKEATLLLGQRILLVSYIILLPEKKVLRGPSAPS